MTLKKEYGNATYGEILNVLRAPGKVYLNFATEYSTLVIQVNKSDMIKEIEAASGGNENKKSYMCVFFDEDCPIYGKHTRIDKTYE